MKLKHVTLLLLISLSFKPFNSRSQGFLKAKGTQIVNQKGENVLLRGIGLGGWMLQEGYMLRVNGQGQQHKIRAGIERLVGAQRTQEFYDAWLDNHTTKADIDSLKAWGFNSVRLPMHFNLYTLPVDKEPVAGQNTWLEKGFAMTDSLLAWCKANKMYLILDLHAAPGGQGNDLNISDRDGSKPSLWESEPDRLKTVALWKKLAERYQDEPFIGAYDILNEPNYGFEDPENDKNGLKEQNNVPLKQLLQDITKAIREVDGRHIIIIEGNGWGNNYNGMLPPWDKNMVLSFHKYWNLNDTKSIQHILDFRQKYNVPVWLGETGENSNVWFTEAIRLFEKNNIGWSWWPLKKLGSNNPLEIRSNEKYMRVINYISGKGSAPASDMAYEGLMAFFLESTFLGILLFGRRLVPTWAHFFAALMVAFGTLLSSFWILSTNSWMQPPRVTKLSMADSSRSTGLPSSSTRRFLIGFCITLPPSTSPRRSSSWELERGCCSAIERSKIHA